jgi:hypothetical protein
MLLLVVSCRFDKVEAMRAEVRRKQLLERKLAGEVEEEEVDGELDKEEAKIDETEDAGGCLAAWSCAGRVCHVGVL